DGRYQACMGVATADVDGNGLIDLFITNFSDESNTLYQQIETGFFADETRVAALRDPSFAYVGFGTQFLDADLDSDPDLLLTNGSLSKTMPVPQLTAELPSQVFENQSGHFRELSAAQAGNFFSRKSLGRGMFRCDWNRDGKQDACISFLDEPAALLTNTTKTDHFWIGIRLVGTTSERIPIGTSVTIHSQEKTQTSQLTAGDGYMSSNEKELILGLGNSSQADSVTVRWPDGSVSSIEKLSAGQRYLIIQGEKNALSLSH
ncbi:MAG: CRTAC1 family protein, partial [Planctomycetaceae bacterium]|nr:CRTAC1 family protein [Planctomycetaceae bacterium]